MTSPNTLRMYTYVGSLIILHGRPNLSFLYVCVCVCVSLSLLSFMFWYPVVWSIFFRIITYYYYCLSCACVCLCVCVCVCTVYVCSLNGKVVLPEGAQTLPLCRVVLSTSSE